MQNEIARSAYDYQRKIESGEKIIIGVNKFQTQETVNAAPFKIDDSIRQVQIDSLPHLKSTEIKRLLSPVYKKYGMLPKAMKTLCLSL